MDVENNMKRNDKIDSAIKSLRRKNTQLRNFTKKLSKTVEEQTELKKKICDSLSITHAVNGQLKEKESVNSGAYAKRRGVER